jgi:hypothetical protein
VPLRHAVAKLVGLKHTPELHFRRHTVSEEETRLAEVWQARTQRSTLFACFFAHPSSPQELARERALDGDYSDSEDEAEEDAPPPAAPPP